MSMIMFSIEDELDKLHFSSKTPKSWNGIQVKKFHTGFPEHIEHCLR